MGKMADEQIMLARAADGEECPLCFAGTVEQVLTLDGAGAPDGAENRCRGECGAVTVAQN